MSTPSTDGKQFANLAYHSAVVSGLAMRYAKAGNTPCGHIKVNALLLYNTHTVLQQDGLYSNACR